MEAAQFQVDVPHSLGVQSAVAKLQGSGGSQVRDVELIDVRANFRCKVDAGFSTRDVTGTVNVDSSRVSLTLDVSGWVPAMVSGLVKDRIEAALKAALEG